MEWGVDRTNYTSVLGKSLKLFLPFLQGAITMHDLFLIYLWSLLLSLCLIRSILVTGLYLMVLKNVKLISKLRVFLMAVVVAVIRNTVPRFLPSSLSYFI